jgi:hypothetical protein
MTFCIGGAAGSEALTPAVEAPTAGAVVFVKAGAEDMSCAAPESDTLALIGAVSGRDSEPEATVALGCGPCIWRVCAIDNPDNKNPTRNAALPLARLFVS